MKRNHNRPNHIRPWLDGKSYHCIREEMLNSHAWRAASHLQRSMVDVVLAALAKRAGRDNGNLIVTNRDFKAWGFSFSSIDPNLSAAVALGLLDQKRGRPGMKGYGKARRLRVPFLPIIDTDGSELEPPSDEWARFSTTEEAKMAAETAYKKAQSSKNRSRNRITSVVIQKSDHLAPNHNRKASAEKPMDIGSAGSEIGSLSRSEEATHDSPAGDVREMAHQGHLPPAMRQFSCVGTGKYTISKDPAAMEEHHCVSARVRFPLIRLVT
jgi:hypothetical protein